MQDMMGMAFGNGLEVKGTWENKRTGERIVARDTIFEDNQMIVLTMDGRRINYDRFQDFVQISQSNLGARPPQPKELNKTINSNTHTNIDAQLSSEVDKLIGNLPTASTVTTEVPMWSDQPVQLSTNITGVGYFDQDPGILGPAPTPQVILPNPTILTALENLPLEEQPVININITWENREILDLLYKYIGVSPEEVAKAIVFKYCKVDLIKEQLETQIQEILGVKSKPVIEEIKEEIQETPPTKPRGRRPKTT